MLFTRALIPLDFSPASVEALRLGVQIALRMGVRLSVLHVDSGIKPDEEGTRKAMARLMAIEVPSRVFVDLLWDVGAPAERINHHAIAGGHDLVVMGTHGKTGLERVFLGSVAELVVRTCSVPVLVTHDRDGVA
jgi:nucleotide-binding universal stress UspA family protein